MTDLTRLPREPVDRLTRPFARFLQIEAAAGGVLLSCTVLALAASNAPWGAAYLDMWETRAGVHLGDFAVSRSLKEWINGGLMTLFFFVVALELKREIVLGELRSFRLAALSIAAALGGMVVPAGMFMWLQRDGAGFDGWATVMASDTAFMVACLALLGRRVPPSARVFLLSLAIFDDVGAILVIAIGFGHALDWGAVAAALAGIATVAACARLGLRSLYVFLLLGAAIWHALDVAGIHPTLAGIVLGLMTPTQRWVSGHRLDAILARVIARPHAEPGGTTDLRDVRQAGVAAREAVSPVERLELALHPWVAFAVMPVFALANAGMPIAPARLDGGVVAAVVASFVVGKPLGVVAFCWLAARLGLALRPAELTWRLLAAASLLTGIGFTMALFIADLAFPSALLASAKVGVLVASVLSAVLGIAALAWLDSAPEERSATPS